jgi:hypothetical protein
MHSEKNMNYITVHCMTVPAWKLKVDILNIFFNRQEAITQELCLIIKNCIIIIIIIIIIVVVVVVVVLILLP